MYPIKETNGQGKIFGVNSLDDFVPRIEELPNEIDPYWLKIAALALDGDIGFTYECKAKNKQGAWDHLNVVIASAWHNLPRFTERLAFLMSEWFIKPEEVQEETISREPILVAQSKRSSIKKLRGGGVP